jgi:hypothetical protein
MRLAPLVGIVDAFRNEVSSYHKLMSAFFGFADKVLSATLSSDQQMDSGNRLIKAIAGFQLTVNMDFMLSLNSDVITQKD